MKTGTIGQKGASRAKTSCVFYGPAHDWAPGHTLCKLTTYETCRPDSCPWYKNVNMLDESYEKARAIWKKNHGADTYYALGLAPLRKRRNEDDDTD